jgi:hypothetical protein
MERKQIKTLALTPELIARVEAERERIQRQMGFSVSFSKTAEALMNRALPLPQQARTT